MQRLWAFDTRFLYFLKKMAVGLYLFLAESVLLNIPDVLILFHIVLAVQGQPLASVPCLELTVRVLCPLVTVGLCPSFQS